jgi:hypothetical protein
VKAGKDWGVNEAGMKQKDDNIGYVLKKFEGVGKGRRARRGLGRWLARSLRYSLAGAHQAGHDL